MTRRIFISGVVSAMLMSNLGAITVFDPSNFAQNILQVLSQAKDYAEQARHYQELARQLQQQMEMVRMQTQNLQNLSKYDWQNLGALLYKMKNVYSSVEAISYDMGNVSEIFDEHYKDFEGYYGDMANASNEEERGKTFAERYRNIAKANQNTLKGTLQKLELEEKDFDSEEAIVKKLKERSANSKGNLEVLQAGNDLMAYQIDETRRLRVTLMTQANAITNYLSAQNNKEILQDAKSKKMKEGKNDWEGKSDLNAIKF